MPPGSQATRRHPREVVGHEAALVVARLVPRVGEEGPQLREGRGIDQLLHRPHRVHGAEADVRRPGLGHPGQAVGHAGPPDLERQHVVRRSGGGQRRRRLTNARPDLHDLRGVAAEPPLPGEAGLVDGVVRDPPLPRVRVPGLLLARREPAAAPRVGQHLPHPAAVLGQPLVRTGRPDAGGIGGTLGHDRASLVSAGPEPT